MSKSKIVAAALLATALTAGRAEAFCLFSCEPTADNARSVFENRLKKKFDPDARIVKFDVSRFWQLDVEGAGHKAVEFYFTGTVEFPKGANLDCKPDDAGAVKAGCSASKYYSTTVSNQEIKDRQYIEPGAKIEFSDETRFDQAPGGWKGQDGKAY
ncbi:hypothetical protein IY145_07440 [Methylosinus sp. H3A]|uniref:hypothetical protein n=1 Tax=Methylosinus sp. H3A TaxID=2785786 RepID=UPI0018C260AA|nr:hypothetical protein [Methylosinus sp. H3A]MBG0809207.1 hypothetical protein [Methylosinus sp. H3A]